MDRVVMSVASASQPNINQMTTRLAVVVFVIVVTVLVVAVFVMSCCGQ